MLVLSAPRAPAARRPARAARGVPATPAASTRAFLCAEHREEMVAPSTERVAEDVARLRSELRPPAAAAEQAARAVGASTDEAGSRRAPRDPRA